MMRPYSPEVVTLETIKPLLPQRDRNAHKGLCGSVAVIGGAEGMVGAVLLAARAALLTGAGRVYAAVLAKGAPCVDVHFPELMLCTPDYINSLSQLDALVIGPGLGKSNNAEALLQYWLKQDAPLLLDADALNLIAAHTYLYDLVQNRHAVTLVTPHPGEAARLLKVDTQAIQQQRETAALQIAQNLNAICVLKGPSTLSVFKNSSLFVNTTGNAALASGGTGDVLSGIIGSLVAQGLAAIDAAKVGVYLHGAAADALVARGIGPLGLTASEVALEVRNLLNQLARIS